MMQGSAPRSSRRAAAPPLNRRMPCRCPYEQVQEVATPGALSMLLKARFALAFIPGGRSDRKETASEHCHTSWKRTVRRVGLVLLQTMSLTSD